MHIFGKMPNHYVIITSKNDVINIYLNDDHTILIHFYVKIVIYISLLESLLS